MSTNDLTRFVFGTPDKTVDTFNQKITGNPTLDDSTYNVTGGMKRGVGVRYSMAPLAGHSNTETPAANETNGLMRSEGITGDGLTYRQAIYGIVPITMAPYDGAYPKANRQYYSYLVGLTYSSDLSLDACLGATLVSSVNKQKSNLSAGLAQSSYRQESPLVRLHKTELLNLPLDTTPTAASMQAILKQVPGRWWMPIAQISVAGKRVPYQWMFARTTSTPDATTAPNLNLWGKQVSFGTNPTILGGSPSEIITREFVDNNQRLLSVYCLDDDGFPMELFYRKQITNANTASVPAYGSGSNYLALTAATKGGASTSYANVAAAIVNDPGSFCNTRHEVVLIAGETPYAVVYQDWLQATKGMMPRWVDLTNPGCIPRAGLSIGTTSTVASSEPSGFAQSNQLILSVVKGILRKDIQYDVGFSYYNKLLDYETNVVFGCSFIPNSDLTSLSIPTWQGATENSAWEYMMDGGGLPHLMPWEWSDSNPIANVETGRGMHVNDYEIRFYYRESGIGEWLPAGSFDAAQLWFFPFQDQGQDAYICQQPVGGLPGGQPNGFVDYSPLPKQRYICAVVSNQRAFWFSEKDFRFSLQNNILAYPVRNVVSSQTGKWRGGIAYSRQDKNNIQGSIIVFGDNGTWNGWFTGNKFVQNVRVSAQEVGQFPVDGSDFQLDYISDSTAFSHRSAIVVEGVAYWWGPQGVYRYEQGVGTPKKISLPLEASEYEQSIFNWVDMGRDTEVHCVYNRRSHEIVWFYPPKVTDVTYPTYGLVFNVENNTFYRYRFKCQVDASQQITLEKDDTPDGVDGERVLLHCRATASSTVQRTFFFDEVAQAGDQIPTRELSVISFTSPSTNVRRLTLAAGSVGINAGGIVAGGYLSFQNVKGYAPGLTLASDMIAKIIGVDNASNWIDIELPSGAVFDATATLTGQTAFPVYHRAEFGAGLHGIPWLYQTNYWLPDGLYQSWYWQYLYFLFKYKGIPQPRDPFHPTEGELARMSLTFESTSGDAVTEVLSLINNTKDHCQIHHPLYNVERSANGQALKFSLSGIHIGDPWTFEYMEAHCEKETGFTLKEFEG